MHCLLRHSIFTRVCLVVAVISVLPRVVLAARRWLKCRGFALQRARKLPARETIASPSFHSPCPKRLRIRQEIWRQKKMHMLERSVIAFPTSFVQSQNELTFAILFPCNTWLMVPHAWVQSIHATQPSL